MSANFLDRIRAALLAILLTAAFAVPALAGPFEDAVAKFANDDFSDTDEAIGAVATSGNPLAFPIISALQEGRLSADPESKKVFVTGSDGKIIDAATGAAVDKLPDSAAAVRLNNRLRRTVEAALGGLTLLSPDPAKRIAAAQSVFKSHEESALAVIDGALAKETNKAAKAAFTEARAAILLYKPDATEVEKLEAVAVVKAKGDQEAMALLTGLGSDVPPNVARAAASAIASIQSNLAMWSMVQNAWYGLSLGSVLLLAAIGLAITFGVMGVINMAHGEMVMIGAYTTFVVQEVIRTRYPGPVRLFAADRGAAGVSGGRRDRRPDRTRHHPLSLWPPAGNAAGDLGPLAGAAAGGAHHVRPDQPRGRQSLLDERRVRTRADHHHL